LVAFKTDAKLLIKMNIEIGVSLSS